MKIQIYLGIALLGLLLQGNNAVADTYYNNNIVKTENRKVEGFTVDGFNVIAWKGAALR